MSLKHVTIDVLQKLNEGAQNVPLTTPFIPRDYNRGKFKCESYQEYIDQPLSTEDSEPRKKESEDEEFKEQKSDEAD